jgi:hypothetical protein
MNGGNVHNRKIDIVVFEHFLNQSTSSHSFSDVHFVEFHRISHSFDQYILFV